ncbi:uncharacterized protein N7518_006900 [Penicillium psychrosexuale]|uniref:uncharacterized protein n=1 Tax=Penicillium psychrosexuale TaxID=1002107 RepID=UPI002545434B|nr:uncharacterized protein N7518_006900 [Penicillium psychrosexuale]KAJ5789889.1 hypothetical protein N7518_006900 [Penicillium psychrosexuale]
MDMDYTQHSQKYSQEDYHTSFYSLVYLFIDITSDLIQPSQYCEIAMSGNAKLCGCHRLHHYFSRPRDPDYRVADFPGIFFLPTKNKNHGGPNAEILPPKVGDVESRVEMPTNSNDEPPAHPVADPGDLPNPDGIPRTMSFLRR